MTSVSDDSLFVSITTNINTQTVLHKDYPYSKSMKYRVASIGRLAAGVQPYKYLATDLYTANTEPLKSRHLKHNHRAPLTTNPSHLLQSGRRDNPSIDSRGPIVQTVIHHVACRNHSTSS